MCVCILEKLIICKYTVAYIFLINIVMLNLKKNNMKSIITVAHDS